MPDPETRECCETTTDCHHLDDCAERPAAEFLGRFQGGGSSAQAAESDHVGVLTMADVVALGDAVLVLDGEAIGFDHNVAEQIVRKHVAQALREAATTLGDRVTMRWLYERESCDWWGDRPVAQWLRERADALAPKPSTSPGRGRDGGDA